MNRLRGFLGIRRMDRLTNVRIRELCGVAKGVDEIIYESIFRWLVIFKEWKGHMWDIWIYVGEGVGGNLGQPRKRWINSVNDYLKKKRSGCWAIEKDGIC